MRPTDKRSLISVECAVRRYVGSVRQGLVPCRADGDAAGQAANYRESAERAELRAEQVRHILNRRGGSLIQFILYRNFGLHVDKLCRDYSDETLHLRVLDAVARWVGYGCTRQILADICREVFKLEVDQYACRRLLASKPRSGENPVRRLVESHREPVKEPDPAE